MKKVQAFKYMFLLAIAPLSLSALATQNYVCENRNSPITIELTADRNVAFVVDNRTGEVIKTLNRVFKKRTAYTSSGPKSSLKTREYVARTRQFLSTSGDWEISETVWGKNLKIERAGDGEEPTKFICSQ